MDQVTETKFEAKKIYAKRREILLQKSFALAKTEMDAADRRRSEESIQQAIQMQNSQRQAEQLQVQRQANSMALMQMGLCISQGAYIQQAPQMHCTSTLCMAAA